MLPRKWPLPMRMIIRWSSVTIAFLAVFELGRVMEMNNNDGRSNPCRRLIGADSHQPDADEHLLDQWQPNDNQQVPPDDAAVKRNEDGERSKLKSLGESMIINGAAAGNSIRSVAVAAAVNDVNDRDIVDEPVNGVDRNQLPKDFWSGRRNDDIFIDTNRPIINPHPFRRTINSPSVCGGSESQGSGVFLLCYVHTAVDHFKRRERIRKTWANQAIHVNVTVRTVFFTGKTNKAAWLQDALEYEGRKYGDIVQEDFLDTYHNLSYKGIAALRWITTYCSRATYVMKTDDDMFVNIFALLKHLKDLYSAGYRRRLIMCYVWWRMHVLRDGQWGIPKEDMPDDLYPVYCSGMGYVFTTEVVTAMYRVSYYEKFFWVDDVYISGCLPRGLRGAVNHTEMSNAYCGAHEMEVYWHPTEWYKYIFTHVHDEELYLRTWRNLVEVARTNTIPTPAIIQPGRLAEYYIPKRVLFPEHQARRANKMQQAEKLMENSNEKRHHRK